MRIRTLGDPLLVKKSKPVINYNDYLIDLSSRMWQLMYDNHGVGLAANQAGYSESIFVYDDRQGNSGVICNPIIEPIGNSYSPKQEGCLSIPGQFHEVDRYEQVRITGNQLDGKSVEIEAKNLLSQIFQHEVDHLEGKLYISKLPKETQMAIVLANQII